MKQELLFEAVGFVGEDLLVRSERSIEQPRPGRRRIFAACAAALLVLLGIGCVIWGLQRAKAPTSMPAASPVDTRTPDTRTPETRPADTRAVVTADGTLPTVDAADSWHDISSRAFQDIRTDWTGNPSLREDWQRPETLPVFRNLAYNEDRQSPVYYDARTLELQAEQIAAFFGETVQTAEETAFATQVFEPGETAPTEPIQASPWDGWHGACESAEIYLEGDGTATVLLNRDCFPLPADVPFSPEDADAAIRYYAQQLAPLTGVSDTVAVQQAHLNPMMSANSDYSAFCDEGDPAQRLLNYSFGRLQLMIDDTGRLNGFCFGDKLACAEKLGDYPLISEAQALEALMSGRYYSEYTPGSLKDGMLRTENIALTELVYAGGYNRDYLPFYRFWLPLDTEPMENGRRDYAPFYVPAVDPACLSEQP